VSEQWQEFASCSDAASAEVAAGLLRSEGVLDGSSRAAPSSSMVVSNAAFTDEELAFFATARLGSDEPADK
jgi:hypothetical protein